MKSNRISNFIRCQIDTPFEIIYNFWNLIKSYRSDLGNILDLGAGDGRFSLNGFYSQYHGIEIDCMKEPIANLPKNAKISHGCAFDDMTDNYDACIGNPPYVRHHYIEKEWRSQIALDIKQNLGLVLNEKANLFIYFMCLGIMKTRPSGLIAMIVPYEWATRPSAKPLRDYPNSQKWGIHIYRFKTDIFKGVLTTASISIIDKVDKSGCWNFYDIDENFRVRLKRGVSTSGYKILPYKRRGQIWAMRGLSPGTQKVFALSEGERIHYGLMHEDVRPCVTSLRGIPSHLGTLNKRAFKKYFIDSGAKCWLIRSDRNWSDFSQNLKDYVESIPKDKRNTATCEERANWYKYETHPEADILYGSGFTSFGPKIVINSIGAIALGTVHGVYLNGKIQKRIVQRYLSNINFEKHIVAHSGSLKKIEVKQMNGVLQRFIKKKGR